MYQRVGKVAYKEDLSNIYHLSNHLNQPELEFKSIHVGGTNGKGSTSHMLASILQEAGYKVGLYTSPHLKDFRERIKINGKEIPKRTVSSFILKHRAYFESQQFSFFEMTVGLAFDYFRKEKVDIAVIEVGLGGRLDSTNIITPEISVITNIGLDHTQFLGNTLAAIAKEKAGIIKRNVPVVIGQSQPETTFVFEDIAAIKSAPIVFADSTNLSIFPSDLKGNYQTANQKTARCAIAVLKEKGWKITTQSIKDGLAHVVKNTGLLGRWQQLNSTPTVICDTAHNREGLTWVLQQLSKEDFNQLYIVLGVVRDKKLDSILPLFPKEAQYFFCAPSIDRALQAKTLQSKAAIFGLYGEVYHTVAEAYKNAIQQANANDFIFIGGSTFVVAEVL